MDILKQTEGFSIIETMTAIVIAGIITMFSIMLIKGIIINPKNLLKSESLMLASDEIDRAINYKIETDTSYYNQKGNLLIERKVVVKDSIHYLSVSVKFKDPKQEIVNLKTCWAK